MVKDHRFGQATEGAAELLPNAGMQLRVAANMKLVDDRALPGSSRQAIVSPGEGWIYYATPRHVRSTVAVIESQIIAALHLISKHGWIPLQLSDDSSGVRIKGQLVRIEAMGSRRVVGAVDTIAVDSAGPGVG